MTSLLLSVLARAYRTKTLEEFSTAMPHYWLVWEPGVWKPPTKFGATLPSIPLGPLPSQPSAGEALALALAPRADRPGQITLGRAASCDIEINDATLSQLHLLFMEAGGNLWTVRDAGSRNGSWVDHQLLIKGMPVPLRPGMLIQAAQVCLTFYDPKGLFERLFAADSRETRD